MSDVTCRLISIVRGRGAAKGWWVDKATRKRPVVGDMFFAPYHLLEPYRSDLAPHYWARPEPRRAPVVVVCPGGYWLCVDSLFRNKERGNYGPGWTVAGEPPRLTLTPSVNIVGSWHGFLTDGVLKTC